MTTPDPTSSAQQALLVLQLDLRDVLAGLPELDAKREGLKFCIAQISRHLKRLENN